MSGLPWGESPYDNKTPREVVDDYVLVRGDLVAEYARAQLATWIERYAAHHPRGAAPRIECPTCGASVLVTTKGKIRAHRHADEGQRCAATGSLAARSA